MKLKRVFRRLAGTFAVTFFIGDIYLAAYAQAYFHGAQSFFWGSSFRWEP